MFKTFEKNGKCIDDESHLFVLHYLFLPRIQEELNEFKNAWINHQISTERNETPLQMLVLGANKFPPEEIVDENEHGVDGNVGGDDDDDDYCVPCDPIFCPLSPENLAIFEARVKPLSLDTPPKNLANILEIHCNSTFVIIQSFFLGQLNELGQLCRTKKLKYFGCKKNM